MTTYIKMYISKMGGFCNATNSSISIIGMQFAPALVHVEVSGLTSDMPVLVRPRQRQYHPRLDPSNAAE